MNIDMGWLGKVSLDRLEDNLVYDGFEVAFSGYTESGIRVHGVVDERELIIYPCVWRNAIMIKVN